MEILKCHGCLNTFTTDRFTPVPTKRGFKRKCKGCMAEYYRDYYKKNPEQYEKHKKYVKNNDEAYKGGGRTYQRHGLTKEVFEQMLGRYNGKCWACREEVATSIDHDHSCCPQTYSCGDCVRGVVCSGCNSALGHVKDSTTRLSSLIEYLNK